MVISSRAELDPLNRVPSTVQNLNPDQDRMITYHLDPTVNHDTSLCNLEPDDLYIRIRRTPAYDLNPSSALWFDPQIDQTSFNGLLMREGELERLFKLEPDSVVHQAEDDEDGLDGRFREYKEDETVREVVLEMYEGSVIPTGKIDTVLAHYNGDILLYEFGSPNDSSSLRHQRGEEGTFLPKHDIQKADHTWVFQFAYPPIGTTHITSNHQKSLETLMRTTKSTIAPLQYYMKTKTPVLAAASDMVAIPIILSSAIVKHDDLADCSNPARCSRPDASSDVCNKEQIEVAARTKHPDDVGNEEREAMKDESITKDPDGEEFEPVEPMLGGVSEAAIAVSVTPVLLADAQNPKTSPTDPGTSEPQTNQPGPPRTAATERICMNLSVSPHITSTCLTQSAVEVICGSPLPSSNTNPSRVIAPIMTSLVPTILVETATLDTPNDEIVARQDKSVASPESNTSEASAEFLLACLKELVQAEAAREAMIVDDHDEVPAGLESSMIKVEMTRQEQSLSESIHASSTEATERYDPFYPAEHALEEDIMRFVLVPSSTSPPSSHLPPPKSERITPPVRVHPSGTTSKDESRAGTDRYRSGKRMPHEHLSIPAKSRRQRDVEVHIPKTRREQVPGAREHRPIDNDPRPKKEPRLIDIPMWTNTTPTASSSKSKVDKKSQNHTHAKNIAVRHAVRTTHLPSSRDDHVSPMTQVKGDRPGYQRVGQDKASSKSMIKRKGIEEPFKWSHSTLIRRGAENGTDPGTSTSKQEIIDLSKFDTSEETRRDRDRRKRKENHEVGRDRYGTVKPKSRNKGMEEYSRAGKRIRMDQGLRGEVVLSAGREVIDLTGD